MTDREKLIERLRERQGSVPVGCDKDGEVVFGDDHDALQAAAELEANAAEIGRLRGALVEAWKRVNEYGYCGPTYRKVRQHWAEQLLINIDTALNK